MLELASWSDIMVVAPATANTLSNLVSGKGDSLFLATICPVMLLFLLHLQWI